MASPLGRLIGSGWTALQRTTDLGRAVQTEVAERLETSDSSILSGLGKMLAPAEPEKTPDSQLPVGLRLARRTLKNAGLGPQVGQAVMEALQVAPDKKVKFKSTQDFQKALGEIGETASRPPTLGHGGQARASRQAFQQLPAGMPWHFTVTPARPATWMFGSGPLPKTRWPPWHCV